MIYLDHNATTGVLPEVWEAMSRWVGVPANPASMHVAGRNADNAVERAREHVARLLDTPTRTVVFTSGSTEAIFSAVYGLQGTWAVSPVEHPAVYGALKQWNRSHYMLPVTSGGRVELTGLPDEVAVIALQAANHEIGTIQDLAEASRVARERDALLFVDATQAAGRMSLSLNAHAGALSSHKLGGPGGIGALVMPENVPYTPMIAGSQERGRRGGSVWTGGAVGFGEACRLALIRRDDEVSRCEKLSLRLRDALRQLGARVVGDAGMLLPNTTTVVFEGLPGATLVAALDLRGVCVSAGAACASGSVGTSPVLEAITDPQPDGPVRFSLGPATSDTDIEQAIAVVQTVVRHARQALDF